MTPVNRWLKSTAYSVFMLAGIAASALWVWPFSWERAHRSDDGWEVQFVGDTGSPEILDDGADGFAVINLRSVAGRARADAEGGGVSSGDGRCQLPSHCPDRLKAKECLAF
jgi:hypothetical protein